MRRSLPFVLFGIAVLTALWLSAQPDRGRPDAARQLQESSSDASAGPSAAPADHTGVWPPDSRMEVTEAPRVGTPPPVSAPPAAQREVDPAHASALRALNAEPDESYATDPASDAPAFDAAAFRNATPGSNPIGAVPPPAPRRRGSRSVLPIAMAPPVPQQQPEPAQPSRRVTSEGSGDAPGPDVDPTLPEDIQRIERDRIETNQNVAGDLVGGTPSATH